MNKLEQPQMLGLDLFDKMYPIVTTEENGVLITSIYLYDVIEEPKHFVEVLSVLEEAQEGDLIILKLNTPGGYLSSALSLLDSIKYTKANVVGHLSGTVASAGTIIALACDDLHVSDYTEFMCHNYSGGTYGKGQEIEAQALFSIPHYKEFMYNTYKDFLTKKEIKRMIKGEDFYFNVEETQRRWANVLDARQKVIDKDLKDQQEAQANSMLTQLEGLGYTVKKPKD